MKIEREAITFLEELSRSPLSFHRESSPSVRIDMSINSDNSVSDDDFDVVDFDPETDEGRLSRSLQTWMTDHVWSNVRPREKLPPEPIYSGKLGQETKYLKERYARYYKSISTKKTTNSCKEQKNGLRRTNSDDSISTHLSLLTCSSYGSEVKEVKIEPIKEKRRRKRENASRTSDSTSDACIYETSPWIRLASKPSSILARFNRTHAALATTYIVAGDDDEFESEAFRLMDKDEQEALMKTGYRSGIIYIDKNKLKRSNSVSNIKQPSPPVPFRRVLSGNAKKSRGKPLDIAELKRERLQRLAMEEAARKQAEREKEMRRRRKINIGTKRVLSNRSLRSQINTGRPGSPSGTSAISASVHSVQSTKSVLSTAASTTASTSGKSSDMRPYSPSEPQSEPEEEEEEKIAVWKGDRQILEIDLRRELTQKVKRKIESTTKALKRCSGLGDGNEQKTQVGVHEEFPKHVEDDYSHKPRIIQRMRISPHLSGVISDDIKVRMGRPRYHEIRINDLEQWNKGFIMNRSHRNLKVFNWLQSLKEEEFIKNVLSEIDDTLPNDEALDLERYQVESADEPDVKPLYRAYEVRIL